jgi:CubicO group peptidase (beta-lactamase class C family)
MLTALLSLALLLQPPPDAKAFADAVAYAAKTDGQAVLVMHRGAVIHERYMAGGAASTRQLLASGSKSFVGLATIAAVADGKVALDAPVSRYLPEWERDPRKARITVRQLLSLESGLESGNAGTGCGGRNTTWTDAVNAGTFAEPGTTFRYGPFPFIAMGAALERTTGESFDAYLARRILAPLGVTVEWRAKCGDGKPQLAGGAAMTARDWATVGEFVRLVGVHKGQRLLPEALVRELFVPAKANPNYGLSWWLVGATLQEQPAAGLEGNSGGRTGRRGGLLGARARRRAGARADNTANKNTAERPQWLPADLVMAAGMGKQRLYVIPSRELVIVRMGKLLGGREFDDVDFLEPLLAPRVGGSSGGR